MRFGDAPATPVFRSLQDGPPQDGGQAPRRDDTAGTNRAFATGPPPLDVRGLRYAVGERTLIDGVDLRLDGSSDSTVIMGPNGAGKSLLLRLLNGLLIPQAGSVRWYGRAPDAAVRRRQAFVFQRPVLLQRSARANVEFVLRLGAPGREEPERPLDRCATPRRRGHEGLGAAPVLPVPRLLARRRRRAARAEALLARVGLGGRGATPARRLSGGEQQRLALACALAVEPEVLLLDEPTASLDPAATAAIETIVDEAREAGVRPLLVTHDTGQARRLGGDVVFLARGRVTEHTPAEEFFVRPRSSEARDYLAGRIVL